MRVRARVRDKIRTRARVRVRVLASSCCIMRFLIFEKSVKTVSRLSERHGSFQSSWIFLMMRGMSAMSAPTGSLSPSLGSGSTKGLPPSRSTRLNRGSFEPG